MSTPRTSVPDIALYLEQERAAVDATLRRALARLLADTPSSLAPALHYAVQAGGKRLRPVLCVSAARAVGAAPDAPGVYEIACALELIHTYSLVHDDLPCMDDDELRRGRPTAHRVFGSARAMLAGAALIPCAFHLVRSGAEALGLPATLRAAMVRELARGAGAGGMVGGQILDLEAEGRAVSLAGLEAIHRRKTGALFAACLRIGGLAADAEPVRVDALGTYGLRLGFAFQITDDVLDETGASAVLGKTAGRDRERAKATFPALLGLDGARERAATAAAAAVAALRGAGIHDDALEALVRFAIDRDR